jgi:hypothetical protein
VQDFLLRGDLASKQEERRAMTLQRTTHGALGIRSVHHSVSKRLKAKAQPTAERALALFQDQAR